MRSLIFSDFHLKVLTIEILLLQIPLEKKTFFASFSSFFEALKKENLHDKTALKFSCSV